MAREVTASVDKSMEHENGSRLEVVVQGPMSTPDVTRSLRARARALVSVGVVNATIDTIEDITLGEIDRLTDEVGDPVRSKSGILTEETRHTIVVTEE